ncbi:MAG: hypothetical protein H0T53_16190 [Herpetosiphonaceae bacterium]|nr:hypothetical protein [Herpetosiphonaceae bacterium]
MLGMAEGVRRGQVRRVLLVGLAYLIAALVVTWPLATTMTTAVPRGTEREGTVPLFNLWVLWWNADRASQGWAGYWDAPIFYPTPSTFAFSEPQPLTGLITTPLWSLGVPPVLIYNLTVLGILLLNGLMAYRWGRAVHQAPSSAFLMGLLAIGAPLIMNFLGVLPLLPIFGMFWILEGLARFSQSESWSAALWTAAGTIVLFLSSQQLSYLFAPFALGAGIVAVGMRRWQPRAALRLGVSSLLAVAIILAIAIPALTRLHMFGFSRSDRIVAALSASPGDFLTRPETALLSIPPHATSDTGGLFPGFGVALLAALGIIQAVRRKGSGWAWVMVAMVVGGAVMAGGLKLNIGGWQPFDTLRSSIPGLAQIRSPFRFAIVMVVGLVGLAGYGAHMLGGRLASPLRGRLVVAILAALAILENLALPLPLTAIPLEPARPWTAWIQTQTAPVLAHVPFPAGVHVAEYEIETQRMYAQIAHHAPLVNGYSGYFPQAIAPDSQIVPTYTQFQLAMAEDFPRYELLCVLQKNLEVTHVVADRPWVEAHSAALLQETRMVRQYADDQVVIYTITLAPTDCR